MSAEYTLTHFYLKGAEPFRSLSALPEEDALRRMRELYIEGSIFWERFEDPAWYLQARKQTEQWLRKQFMAKGGCPREPYPIYMIFGRSRWVEQSADPATLATTDAIQVPLSLFSAADISFTYPDSMAMSLILFQKDPAIYRPELHGHVFTLPEILAFVGEKGLPGEGWESGLPAHLADYIEAQVWNRQPLDDFLARPGTPAVLDA